MILKLGSRHLKQNHSFSIKSENLNKLMWGEMKTLFDHKNNANISVTKFLSDTANLNCSLNIPNRGETTDCKWAEWMIWVYGGH